MTSQQFERLDPFLADAETTIDGYSTATEIGVLTDRQLLSLQTTGGDGRTTRVNATYLDQLSGATLTQHTSPDYDEETLGYGIGALFIGLISLVLGALIDGGGPSALLLLLGIGVGVLGIVLVDKAYDTPDDRVTITLQRADGGVARRLHLPTEYSEFAETVSRTASTAHAVDDEVTRTIG